MQDNTTTNTDQPVGYKKPPKHSQFSKGQSGNPSGRPRKAKNGLKDLFAERLGEMVVIPGTKRTHLSRCQVLVHNLVKKAAHGDVRSLTELINMMELDESEAPANKPDWMVVSYTMGLTARGPETFTEEFYKGQERNIALWKKELRTGPSSVKGMIEQELSRKVSIDGSKRGKVAVHEIIVARFIKEANDNPSILKLLFKLVPRKKFKRDYSRIEFLRPTEDELKWLPAPGVLQKD